MLLRRNPCWRRYPLHRSTRSFVVWICVSKGCVASFPWTLLYTLVYPPLHWCNFPPIEWAWSSGYAPPHQSEWTIPWKQCSLARSSMNYSKHKRPYGKYINWWNRNRNTHTSNPSRERIIDSTPNMIDFPSPVPICTRCPLKVFPVAFPHSSDTIPGLSSSSSKILKRERTCTGCGRSTVFIFLVCSKQDFELLIDQTANITASVSGRCSLIDPPKSPSYLRIWYCSSVISTSSPLVGLYKKCFNRESNL